MFAFNDAVDRVALKPAATAYKQVLPTFVQTGVSNFFGNLSDLWTGANNLMQGKGADGMSDLTRFAVNSTLGLGGLLDIGSRSRPAKAQRRLRPDPGRLGRAVRSLPDAAAAGPVDGARRRRHPARHRRRSVGLQGAGALA